ncbi:MAG TPA: sugar ABC transporter ATP-binding protein [Spirochaetia bacterium]|nr:sugar ABC transporter ATP-binding protein [Spirochaetia bacterium]
MSEPASGYALEMKRVGKRFPGTIAVDDVTFEVRPGEVHALVGENGAGKSTLMKILAGSFDDYTGEIAINGHVALLHSPTLAKRHGIGMIYQELSLARPISITENLLAGRLPRRGPFLDKARARTQARELLAEVGLDLDPSLPIEDISQHEAQLVEIAKVLGNRPSILVMDEPTSALSREEVERLFTIIGELKGRGIAIVYISHHLPEIFRIADRVTVMRDGKKIATRPVGEVSREEIVQMMVGRSVKEFYRRGERSIGEVRLRVRGLSRFGFFHGIDLEARRSEILGICGLSGAGRTELARVLTGLDRSDEGTIELDGQRVRGSSMADFLDQGISYLTEDRKTEGLAVRLAVDDNILSAIVDRLSSASVFSKARGKPAVERLIAELSIYPPDPSRTVANLSGGNQQKVLLAKWLATQPKVLILDEPTRGVDIGAKMTIHASIEKLAREGCTVLLISSDLPELVGLCDRVMIMRKGHFIREMPYSECSEESLLLAANGDTGHGEGRAS